MHSKNKKTKTILILAGGTGGHIFPAEAFAILCKKNKDNIHWIGTNRGLEKQITQKHNINFIEIKFNGLKGKSLLKFIKFPISLIFNIIIIKKNLKKIKPDITISFGGYSTVPGAIASYLNKTPIILHEQNAKLGRANKFISYFAKKHTSAYESVFPIKYLKTSKIIGNPLREDFIINKNKKYKNNNQTNILILGGSLGARFLNNLIPNIINNLNINSKNLNIIHQTGKYNFNSTQELYKKININKNIKINIKPFIDDISHYYKLADIIICRAGALTVSEVSLFGIPAIYIPYPFAMDNHQWHNAQPLVKNKAAFCLEEKDIKQNNKIIINIINQMLNNPDMLNNMHENAINFAMTKLNATENLYKIAIEHLNPFGQSEYESLHQEF